jgi:hypothetical protein
VAVPELGQVTLAATGSTLRVADGRSSTEVRLSAFGGDGETLKEEFNRRVRRTAFTTVGLAAALVFGIIVLVSGDWLAGTIIVAAALIGLALHVPVIRRLCRTESSPTPVRHKPAR